MLCLVHMKEHMKEHDYPLHFGWVCAVFEDVSY